MEWLDSMNEAMAYIEAHLSDRNNGIDYVEIAKAACCSSFHFQRVFPFITGITLSDYISRRRLTLAAFDLQTSDIKVIDVALKYGYESPEAFSRAFKLLNGVMPISARDNGTILKTFPRLSFQIMIKGDTEMNYRIEEKEAFEIFGLELKTNTVNGQCFKDIPAFWEACEKDG